MAIVIVFCAGGLLPSAAYADNYDGATGQDGLGCMPNRNIKADNKDHYFFYSDLSADMIAVSDEALADDYVPTNLDTYYGTFSGSDVIVRDFDYNTYCGYNWDGAPDYLLALAECRELNASNECAHFAVRFDRDDMDNLGPNQRQSVACHEYGHTVGLEHRDAGCMTNGATFPGHLTDHDVNKHINVHY